MHDVDDALPNTQPGGSQSINTTSQGSTKAPEDSVVPVDGKGLMDNEVIESYPVPINIIINKEGMNGALAFEVVADDGDIQISRMYHYFKKEWADAETEKQDYAHKITYTGPAYGSLDEDLQRLVEDYLRERGVDTMLAQWVPEYIDFKEQREYMKWLDGKENTCIRLELRLTLSQM